MSHKRKKGRMFMKMTKEFEVAEIEMIRNSSKSYLVFKLLTRNMSDDNSVVISVRTMRELLQIGKSTVERSIEYLEDHKFIKKSRVGSTNVYHVNSKVVTVKKGLDGCKFNATIVMGEYETKLNKGNYDIK